MKHVTAKQTIFTTIIFVAIGVAFVANQPAQASCGSTSCFLAIGNQPAVQPKDLLRVDLTYSYAPMKSPNRHVAAVNVDSKKQILDEHFEQQTINQQLTLNLNYGVTDNLTLQLAVPAISRDHDHQIEVGADMPPDNLGEFENFDTTGLGDIRLMTKYGFLPTLRSLLVFGVGVDFPSGDYESRNVEGKTQEPTLQIGRGEFGIVAHGFQAYELIPHKLNQFFSYTYTHTFENKFDYQFGDTHQIAGGLSYQVTPTIALSGQLNYTYRLQDECKCSLAQAGPSTFSTGEIDIDTRVRTRGVRNTGSTNLMFSPGVTLNLGNNTSWYFYGQAPLVQDFNQGLEQGPSFLTGFVKFFTMGGSS